MKQYKKCIYFFVLILAPAIILTGCKKDHKPALEIEGFDVLDMLGNPIAHVGAADNDWTFNNTLTNAEMALFDFATTENLQNTTQATLSAKLLAYPNPTGPAQNFSFSASDSVLMKIVIVNNDLKVLTKGAIKFKGDYTVTLDYSDDKQNFHDGASLRVYYSFSAASKQNFKVGYGDIKLCYNSSGDYMECF